MIGDELRKSRVAAELTQEELASRSGLHRSYQDDKADKILSKVVYCGIYLTLINLLLINCHDI